jgi:ribonuclease Z
MNVVFLGTSGSMPTDTRGSSSIAVKIGRSLVMFDCGEGTQRQMVKARVGFRREMKILISHMHGDHVLGLPGLFQTMSLLGREKRLDLYGPIGLIEYVKAFSETLGGPTFPVVIHELTGAGTIYTDEKINIKAIQSSHHIESYSFGIFENPRPGRFHPEKAEALGVPRGRLWHNLQHGKCVNFDGRVVQPEQVVDMVRPGRRIVYSGDTRPFEEMVKFAYGADLLIHEATFAEELSERAEEDGHSTTVQAADIAKRANVSKLVLTHISSRYPDSTVLLREAKKVFKNVIVAEDLMELEVELPI